jgi:hypothetical protein
MYTSEKIGLPSGKLSTILVFSREKGEAFRAAVGAEPPAKKV